MQIIIRFSIDKLPFSQQSSSFSLLQNEPQPIQQPYHPTIPSTPSFPLPKTSINVKNIANFASKAISFSNFRRERTNPKPLVCHFNTFRGQILTFHLPHKKPAKGTQDRKTAQALWNDGTCAVDVCWVYIILLHRVFTSTDDTDTLSRILHTAALQVVDDVIILLA